MNLIQTLYDLLYERYGPQGWWPLLGLHNNGGVNLTKSGLVDGYHPGDYSYPKTSRQSFEICIGAILTQNTSWVNVERALINLEKNGLLDPTAIMNASYEHIASCIRPSGYFNQKNKKIRAFSEFFYSFTEIVPSRKTLLKIWGIGPETADSILLYAFKVPSFVIDAYTRRILTNLGISQPDMSYDELQNLFHSNLEMDVRIYQEYHALLVVHAKRHYHTKPYEDPLRFRLK